MARVNNPAIVVMDLRLPKANGIDAANRIKEDNPECRIIVTSMYKVEEFKRAYSKGTVEAIIPKNEIYERLIPLMRRCLDESPVS
jgi:DNA-binding NarL/FixJ family response regulator